MLVKDVEQHGASTRIAYRRKKRTNLQKQPPEFDTLRFASERNYLRPVWREVHIHILVVDLS